MKYSTVSEDVTKLEKVQRQAPRFFHNNYYDIFHKRKLHAFYRTVILKCEIRELLDQKCIQLVMTEIIKGNRPSSPYTAKLVAFNKKTFCWTISSFVEKYVL